MIDIHCHVLPGMDDGSKTVEESVQLLRASAQQGIMQMAATPHFYPEQNSPEVFLERRARAEEKLEGILPSGLPALRMGAEVYYFEGINRTRAIDDLRIAGTELLLLEMPFSPWSKRMLQEVTELQAHDGITVLLAHIERYLGFQETRVWEDLIQAGVLMQCNAGFLLNWRTRRKAMRMLKAGRIHFVASDCHNMQLRPPNLGKAFALMDRRERMRLRALQRAYVPQLPGQASS